MHIPHARRDAEKLPRRERLRWWYGRIRNFQPPDTIRDYTTFTFEKVQPTPKEKTPEFCLTGGFHCGVLGATPLGSAGEEALFEAVGGHLLQRHLWLCYHGQHHSAGVPLRPGVLAGRRDGAGETSQARDGWLSRTPRHLRHRRPPSLHTFQRRPSHAEHIAGEDLRISSSESPRGERSCKNRIPPCLTCDLAEIRRKCKCNPRKRRDIIVSPAVSSWRTFIFHQQTRTALP